MLLRAVFVKISKFIGKSSYLHVRLLLMPIVYIAINEVFIYE